MDTRGSTKGVAPISIQKGARRTKELFTLIMVITKI